MKRKQVWLTVLLGVCVCLLLPVGAAASEAKKTQSDIGIEFEKTTDSSVPIPPKPKPPVIDPGGDQTPPKLLPKTGEVITSMIVMLIGVSIAVFVLGISVLKQVYQEPSWEY